MQTTLPSYDEVAVMDESRYALDKKLHVTFYMRAVMNNYKSAQEGRPIFDEKEFVRIITPGDKNAIFDQPVNDEHRRRFEAQYARFKKGLEQAQSGTPLEVWPQMTVGMVAELKALNVSTVEQLADLSDTLAQRIMGANQWRQKAKVFLAAAAGEAATTKLQAELEARDAQIAALTQQMAELTAAVKAQAAKTPAPTKG